MKVRVRVLQNVSQVKLVDRQLGPFEAGQEVELELWEIGVLRRNGLAEPAQRVTLTELRKLLLAEEQVFELSPLPASLHTEVAEEVAYLRAMGELEKAEEIRAAIDLLVELRIHKLLRSALSPAEAKGALPEEKFLLNRLATTAEEWTRQIAGKIEKGEEVEKHGVLGEHLPGLA